MNYSVLTSRKFIENFCNISYYVSWFLSVIYLFIFIFIDLKSFIMDFYIISFVLILMVFNSLINRKLKIGYTVLIGLIIVPLFFAKLYMIWESESCIVGELDNNSYDFIYYSYTTYTTLGYGDLRPVGPCRVISSVEAVLGYVFMAFLASQFYRLHVGKQ